MWATLPSYHQGHLTMSGDIFGDLNLEEGEKLLLPSGGWRSGMQPTMHRTDPTTKN